jgi:hypothetical protein
MNALDHGCRANILVLPTEDFGEYENQCRAWKLSFKPRNPSEEFLIDGIVSLGWRADRINRAHTARLAKRIHEGGIDQANREQDEVIALGQRLFQVSDAPQASQRKDAMGKSARDAKMHGTAEFFIDPDDPTLLVDRLERTGTGCELLLGHWGDLRALLEREVPWVAPDKLKAVLLLGRRPTDVLDSKEVAQVYLASHVLLNKEGNPFQEILNELAPDRARVYENYLKHRYYEALAPRDAAAAREVLLVIVDRATERLEEKAEELRQLAELEAPYTAARLSWDDTAEGERLRRYELTTERVWSRMFDLLIKIRLTGDELDIATIQSLGRSIPTVSVGAIDRPAPFVANVVTPPAEPDGQPDPPIEANLARENAPNEANLSVQALRSETRDRVKDLRVDAPHLDRKPGGIGITGKATGHPVLERVLRGRNSTLMNLSPIFGKP